MLFAQLGSDTPPDVVVLDPGTAGMEKALELAVRFDQQCPAVSVVLVSDSGTDIRLPAMRAGVRDVLHPGADVSDIRVVLDRAAQAAARAFSQTAPTVAGMPPAGRVISVVSPKAGSARRR